MRLFLLALTAALLAVPIVRAVEPVQVELRVTLVSVPESFLTQTSVINLPVPGKPIKSFGVIPDEKKPHFMQCLHDESQAKVLAEPRLVALSGRPAHFLSGGEQAVLTGKGGVEGPDVGFIDVGTELDVLPIVLANGRIYLEMKTCLRSINGSSGIKTSFGFVPGLDEQSIQTAVETSADQTFAIALADPAREHCVQLLMVTPRILKAEVPATMKSAQELRLEKKAARLMEKYHDACEAGDPERARKLARQALDLDPECFNKLVSRASAIMSTIHMNEIINQSEEIRNAREEWQRIWFTDQPSNVTPKQTPGGK